MTITISAIIPAYNCETTLGRALDSILNQAVPPTEIIVVNDGSTDNTVDVMESYAKEHPSIRAITQENAGPGAARNHGARLAKSDWVAFLDSDDLWYPWHLENMVKILEEHPEVSWASAACEIEVNRSGEKAIFGDHASLSPIVPNYFATIGKEMPAINSNSIMVHRLAYEECEGFREGSICGEDIWLWFRLGFRYPQLAYSPIASTLYLYEPTSLSKRRRTVQEVLDLQTSMVDEMIEEVKSRGAWDREEAKRFLGGFTGYILCFALMDSNRTYRKMRAKYRSLLPYCRMPLQARIAARFALLGFPVSRLYAVLAYLHLIRSPKQMQ